jgi:hypothetical protein
LSNSTSAAAAEAIRELLAVVREDLLRSPTALQRLAERQTDGAARRALDDARDHAIARVIIETQGNRNSLIDHPDWATRIDFGAGFG